MPMATGISAAAPLPIAFCRLLAVAPGPIIRAASVSTRIATTIRAPA
jgi:hypothetical protein